MKKVLIMPLMGSKYVDIKFFRGRNNIFMYLTQALMSVDLNNFDDIYFVISKEVNDTLLLADRILLDLKLLKKIKSKINTTYHITILADETRSMAETVYECIKAEHIPEDCELFIKDGDNRFTCEAFGTGNFIMTASLESQTLADPTHKSYVNIDKYGFVKNAIEKLIISHEFIAGGYNFKTVSSFITGYEALEKITESFYISDIIFWLILYKNEKFRQVKTSVFEDFNLIKNRI